MDDIGAVLQTCLRKSLNRRAQQTGMPGWAGIAQSVLQLATGWLDGLGTESMWKRDFPHLSRPALGYTQSSIQWVPGYSRG